MLFAATVEGTPHRVEVRARDGVFLVTLDGRAFELDLVALGDHFASVLVDGHSHEVGFERTAEGCCVQLASGAFSVEIGGIARGPAAAPLHAAGPQQIRSPMPGRVVQVLVHAGEQVEAGRSLVVIEAMKMENELRAPRSGEVREIAVREGETVDAGSLVVVIV